MRGTFGEPTVVSMASKAGREQVDAVVVGARCAGSAAAIAIARGGRSVIAIDRTAFPSDTLSTHVNFPSAVSEINRVGALDRVLAYSPPLCREGMVQADGVRCLQRFAAVDGIDYGICVPRTQLDMALVETARAAGADVREKTGLVDVLWDGDRATGVRVSGPEGEYEIGCSLVIGADGRRSTTASRVGSDVPYRGSRNGRGAAFWYMDDPLVDTEWHQRLIQLRQLETHALIFPCPGGRLLVLFMGPAEEVPLFRRDPEGQWDRMLRENPAVAERVGGATNRTKLRSTGDFPAFYRRSSGPGWALAGDAGHFKDPIIGQGIRDAIRFARLLGEAAGPVIDDPERLDSALLAVERRRDQECMASYHWGNKESRIFPVSPLLKTGLAEWDGADPPHLLHMFDRVRAPHHVLNPLRGAKWGLKAMLKPGTDRRALLAEMREELRIDKDIWREEILKPFRPTRAWASERSDFTWPPRSAAEASPAAADSSENGSGPAVLAETAP